MGDRAAPRRADLRHPFGISRYVLAGLSVFGTVAVQLAVNPGPSLTIPLLVSMVAVTLTAYFAGCDAALCATAANLLINGYFLAVPRFSLAVANPGDRWRVVVFAASGIGISLLSRRFFDTRLFGRAALLFSSSLLLVIVALLVWFDIENSSAAEGWVEHTYQVLNASERLFSGIEDADARQRGYLLTGEQQYLDRYRELESAEKQEMELLRPLTTDNPVQQARLGRLERLINTRLAMLERGIAIRRSDGLEAAIAVVRLGESARLTSSIRMELAALEAEEHRLLTARTKSASAQAAHTRAALAGGTALLLGLVILAGFVIESDIAKLSASGKTLGRQADLLDEALEPIFTWKLGGPIDYWNRGAQELYGFNAAEVIGYRSYDLLHTRYPPGMAAIEELLLRNNRWRGELTHVVNGREIVVESLMTLVTESDGRRTVLEANRDITEEKRAQQEIRQLNQELEQRVKDRTVQLEASNKELEAFAYAVSHDLRAPLRGINGWSQALAEDYGHSLDATARQYLDRVRSETQRMGRLIDDLLKLSRLTRVALQHESVELSSLARSIAGRLRESEPGRRIEFVVEDGLVTCGDGHLLEIVLTNLLSNSVKFTSPRDLARIEFGRTHCNGKPAFYVRDNGVGFDMAHAQMLFGAFQRMHRQSEFPGNGIGLATAQRVLRRHGGTIWAETKPDQGATFYFTIPGHFTIPEEASR